MRNFFKMVLLFISSLILFIDINVFASSYDLFIEDEFISYDDIEFVYEKHIEKVKEYENTLECSRLDSNTIVEEVVEEIVDEKFESFVEKEQFVSQLINNGYSVNENVLIEDGILTSYSFIIINGKISSTKVNETEVVDYNGLDYEEVLLSFKDVETNDYKVINTILGDTSVYNEGKIVFDTLEEVELEVNRLESLNYNVYYESENDKYVLYYSYEINEYNVFVEKYDKDYVISASKVNYIVRTIGYIVEDEMCGIGDEYEEIIPPHTYVSENAYFNIILFYENRKKK